MSAENVVTSMQSFTKERLQRDCRKLVDALLCEVHHPLHTEPQVQWLSGLLDDLQGPRQGLTPLGPLGLVGVEMEVDVEDNDRIHYEFFCSYSGVTFSHQQTKFLDHIELPSHLRPMFARITVRTLTSAERLAAPRENSTSGNAVKEHFIQHIVALSGQRPVAPFTLLPLFALSRLRLERPDTLFTHLEAIMPTENHPDSIWQIRLTDRRYEYQINVQYSVLMGAYIDFLRRYRTYIHATTPNTYPSEGAQHANA